MPPSSLDGLVRGLVRDLRDEGWSRRPVAAELGLATTTHDHLGLSLGLSGFPVSLPLGIRSLLTTWDRVWVLVSPPSPSPCLCVHLSSSGCLFLPSSVSPSRSLGLGLTLPLPLCWPHWRIVLSGI